MEKGNKSNNADPGYLLYVSDESKSKMTVNENVDFTGNPTRELSVINDYFLPKLKSMPLFFAGVATSFAVIAVGFKLTRNPATKKMGDKMFNVSLACQAGTFGALVYYMYKKEKAKPGEHPPE